MSTSQVWRLLFASGLAVGFTGFSGCQRPIPVRESHGHEQAKTLEAHHTKRANAVNGLLSLSIDTPSLNCIRGFDSAFAAHVQQSHDLDPNGDPYTSEYKLLLLNYKQSHLDSSGGWNVQAGDAYVNAAPIPNCIQRPWRWNWHVIVVHTTVIGVDARHAVILDTSTATTPSFRVICVDDDPAPNVGGVCVLNPNPNPGHLKPLRPSFKSWAIAVNCLSGEKDTRKKL